MNNKELLLKEGKISSTLFKLSIPLIISQLINVLYNVVDRIYIGNIPDTGHDALAGVGIAFPIIMIVSAFAALFGMGGAPQASIKLGEGKPKEATEFMNNSIVMLSISGLIITLALVIFDEPLLHLFGAKESIIGYSSSYLQIYALGTIFVLFTLGLNPYISAQGFTHTAMNTVLIGAILNIILDPLFIYLLQMGVAGAALATIISQGISAIYVILFLRSPKPIMRLFIKRIKINRKVILSIMALGISPFIMQATESIVQISFNIQIKAYGGENYINYLNLITIMMSINFIIAMPIIGLTQGATPLISYNYGAKQIGRVKETYKLSILFSLLYSFSFYLLIILMPKSLAGIFNQDPELLEMSSKLFKIFFLGMSIFGVQIACQNTFMALRQSFISLTLALLRKVILLIPLTFILPLYFGIKGVFYSEPIADGVAVLVTSLVFMGSIHKILNKKIEDDVMIHKKVLIEEENI